MDSALGFIPAVAGEFWTSVAVAHRSTGSSLRGRETVQVRGLGRTPPARGSRPSLPVHRGSTPARAGKCHGDPALLVGLPPHARGNASLAPMVHPRTRGNSRSGLLVTGPFPARAGRHEDRVCDLDEPEVDPRLRGVALRGTSTCPGSIPARVRGGSAARLWCVCGRSPLLRGTLAALRFARRWTTVQPRAGGETFQVRRLGRTPPARGSRPSLPVHRGSTPARAGKCHRDPALLVGLPPHARGNASLAPMVYPRTRGNSRSGLLVTGPFPARAGRHEDRVCDLDEPEVDPRACGVAGRQGCQRVRFLG